MPIIRLDYDSDKVSQAEATALSEAAQKIVSEATGIEDVFVYGNSSEIKLKVAPVEIFVEMSAQKIADADKLIAEIKSRLLGWEKKRKFPRPLKITPISRQWKD